MQCAQLITLVMHSVHVQCACMLPYLGFSKPVFSCHQNVRSNNVLLTEILTVHSLPPRQRKFIVKKTIQNLYNVCILQLNYPRVRFSVIFYNVFLCTLLYPKFTPSETAGVWLEFWPMPTLRDKARDGVLCTFRTCHLSSLRPHCAHLSLACDILNTS
jgi:hypothetical protein